MSLAIVSCTDPKTLVSGICCCSLGAANIHSSASQIYYRQLSSSWTIRTLQRTPVHRSASDATRGTSMCRVLLNSHVNQNPSVTEVESTLELDRVNTAVYETGEPASSSQTAAKTVSTRKSMKEARANRKTSRRRILAICLALATITQHGSRGEQQANSAVGVEAKDLITISANPGGERLSASSKTWEKYGDLVTVSTGSPNSLQDGTVKGLPSWIGGNYHLCMGDGFHVQLPANWDIHDTGDQVFGTVLRYEDKENPSTNVIVLKSPTSQSRTDDLGNPEDWIREQAYLLTGSNEALQFQTGEEGIDAAEKFPSGRVSIAKVLNVDKPKNKQGLTYYTYEIVTKQGGYNINSLHELVSAVVNDGTLYMCRFQTDEGQWQQNTQRMAQRIVDSFQITGFKIRV